MSNIRTNRAYVAPVPEGYEAHGPHLYLVPAMAWGALRQYHSRALTERQWGALLRRMRFAPDRIASTKAKLCALYTAPLSFDEWCRLFEQLATEHVLATKYTAAR